MNDAPADRLLVDFHRDISAPLSRVFEAWLDPVALATFLKPAPGVVVEDLSVDATEGGAFSLTMCIGDTRMPIRGVYRQIRPHSRLVFSWLSGATTANSEVTLTFTEPSPGVTRLHLRHVGFPDEHSRGNHDGGWMRIVELLRERLAPS